MDLLGVSTLLAVLYFWSCNCKQSFVSMLLHLKDQGLYHVGIEGIYLEANNSPGRIFLYTWNSCSDATIMVCHSILMTPHRSM